MGIGDREEGRELLNRSEYMSIDHVVMHTRQAKECASQENQIDSIIKALEMTGRILRELEARVTKLEKKW